MSPRFPLHFINGLTGDPAVAVSIPQSSDIVLFDAGNLDAMSNKELLKVRVVAISHTHVDHFIGFDRLLRVNIPHFRTVEVVGPRGIIANIQGKLAGYTWNLLEPNQINFIVHEVTSESGTRSVRLTNNDQFTAHNLAPTNQVTLGSPTSHPIPLQTIDVLLETVIMDHGMDVLSFCLKTPQTYSFSREQMTALGLTPGPWISNLQSLATDPQLGTCPDHQDSHRDQTFAIDGKTYDFQFLRDQLLTVKQGLSLVYLTDIVFSQKNIEALKLFNSMEVDTFICETNFKAEHRDRAFAKYHLTTFQAAVLSTILNAKEMKIFHISNIYGSDFEPSVVEASEALAQLKHLPKVEFEQLIATEVAARK